MFPWDDDGHRLERCHFCLQGPTRWQANFGTTINVVDKQNIAELHNMAKQAFAEIVTADQRGETIYPTMYRQTVPSCKETCYLVSM